ncbi:MAG: methylenetetrahydrofolate--tRNA-(uracil(54)-C(5))-methyltransferase (FADH(2)-oxidizing) TrmFO [Anaerolineaceae bacterium]|nr:methylenetetrahydrofolate--tRNA-(uracil(54)-C(5))-methyltransferase (FADH(2)-oxidizing) TrmFO [Anaerolineaceae bacterium]
MPDLIIVGGGLAGCEAAWQAAKFGLKVTLFEMRPIKETGAHTTDFLSELVCSNSFGSNLVNRVSGLLKEEIRMLGSFILECAEQNAVPAGGALAVDRDDFARMVTNRITRNPNIDVIRKEIMQIPHKPAIIASGPLTSEAISTSIQKLLGQDNLYFYDAIAPIVTVGSINMDIAYRASRYGRGNNEDGDYINCPFTKEQYSSFINSLLTANKIELRSFEKKVTNGVRAGSKEFFEGCLPIEVLAERGHDALAYGPMRPVGLINPKTGKHPFAVLQLRQDNLAGSLYNLVGFQTNLTYSEQNRILRMIPGLENAEFIRYGQMHRNTFISSPAILKPDLQLKQRHGLFFAGQIIGVEGYIGNVSTGLLAGINAASYIKTKRTYILPVTTIIGALCNYVSTCDKNHFQPMKANFGILPEFSEKVRGKRNRAKAHAERSLADLKKYLEVEMTQVIK